VHSVQIHPPTSGIQRSTYPMDRRATADRATHLTRRPAHEETHRPCEGIAARGAHPLIPVKGKRPTLFAQLKTLPWAQIPKGRQTREAGHGRREIGTIKAVAVTTPGGIGFRPAPVTASGPPHRRSSVDSRSLRALLTVPIPPGSNPANWARNRSWYSPFRSLASVLSVDRCEGAGHP
jgi:hypothetical protein